MADDFDVEAMLEAPYRKVGLKVGEVRPVLLLGLFIFRPFIFATVTKLT